MIKIDNLIEDKELSEDQECFDFVQYLISRNLKFSHISNEMPAVRKIGEKWVKNKKTITRNKLMGLNKGVPDYVVIIEREGNEKAGQRNNVLIFIEMKRKKTGKVSKEQAEWINALNKVFGVVAVVARGFNEAKEVIDAYVGPGEI